MKKIFYIIVILLIYSNTVQTQPDLPISEKKVPTMNGHTFPSSSHFGSSFITTHLHADLGFGLTSTLKIPGIIIDDYEIFSFEGQILFFNTAVQYQQRFTPWLALYLSFGMSGRVGTDISTIMADGVNTLSGGDIGWLIRITRSEKFNLSGSIRVQNLTGNFINVTDYFRDLINNVPDPSVTKKVPAMLVGVGIRGAYAFNPTFGLQFQGDFDYGETFERSKTKGYYSAGLMGDVDFLPKHNTAVGLALGYAITSAPEIVMGDGGMSHLISGKIGYTGSDDFELGVQYTYYNVNLKSVDEKPFISKILLILKFYF
jgi:hypothetical protein